MAKIERSPSNNHFIYVSDVHMGDKIFIPIYSKRDLLTLIKLASESLLMLEKDRKGKIMWTEVERWINYPSMNGET